MDCISVNVKKQKKPSYGLYFHTVHIFTFLIVLCIGMILVTLGFFYHRISFFVVGIIIIFYNIVSTGLSYVARYIIPGSPVKVADDLIQSLDLKGDEVVLDVGTGRGLYAIESAKQLPYGKVIGIDMWDSKNVPQYVYHHKLSQPSGNTIENAKKNIQIAGVGNKVELINMDVNALHFQEGYFDVVICAYVISHLGPYRKTALKEIYRTLKPGGKLVIIDNIIDLTYMLLSTPHLFLLSYLRGKKARYLTKEFWISMVSEQGFVPQSFERKPGIVKWIGSKP